MYICMYVCMYVCMYSEISLIRHSMGPENNVGLGGSWIMECLLPYLSMVTVPHIMVGIERMLDYRDVGLERFRCMYVCIHLHMNGLKKKIMHVHIYIHTACTHFLCATPTHA